MTARPFIKMHGLGNDFVVIDARKEPFPLTDAQARAISDRRIGIGCDQLIVIEPAQNGGAAFMRIRNRDGGEAEACGNATRCIADMLMQETGTKEISLETLGGALKGEAREAGLVAVDMGPAYLEWPDIPLAEAMDTLHVPANHGVLEDACCVGVGNPHAVYFVEDAGAVALEEVGPVLEHHPLFPARANIEVIHLLAENRLRMRVWERGGGITLACGSGACAVVVAAHRRGLTGRRAEVVLDGGSLDIDWRDDNHIWMTGPVATVFTGTLDANLLS